MKGLQEFGINDTIKNTFCNMYEMGVYMKKQIIAFVMILIMALFGIYSYMTNPSLQEKLASYTEEDFSEDNMILVVIAIAALMIWYFRKNRYVS